jgi:hypothetical protein
MTVIAAAMTPAMPAPLAQAWTREFRPLEILEGVRDFDNLQRFCQFEGSFFRDFAMCADCLWPGNVRA